MKNLKSISALLLAAALLLGLFAGCGGSDAVSSAAETAAASEPASEAPAEEGPAEEPAEEASAQEASAVARGGISCPPSSATAVSRLFFFFS